MNATKSIPLILKVSNSQEMNERLDAATASIREEALALRQGILVTRSDWETFVIGLSDEVPFGHTLERYGW